MTVPWKSWALPGLPSVVRLTEPLPLVLSTKAVLPSRASATAVGKYPAWRKPRTRPWARSISARALSPPSAT